MTERAAFILGTAGHVDHGKTTLIKALTGIDTDRLPEEKARGLSIDLGFAHLALPSGRVVGIVDVPGHERFLKNMLAGVGGYDLAMLVIDAVEGIKPQTREHLEILQMLSIRSGLVALTKTDLQESEYLPLVQEDVRKYLEGSFLASAPIVPVSSTTGVGLDLLRQTIDKLLDAIEPRSLETPFRLPVDRVFVKQGFGTVVTGSLWSGRLVKGDRVEILPQGTEARVRTLQVFGETRDVAVAGERVAINLAGIDADALHRGNVISLPGALKPTQIVDVTVEVLPDAPRPLKNRAWARVYVGTQEALGKLVLLESDEVKPGSSGPAQLLMDEPIVARRQDRFVLRNATAEFTIGGGSILDTDPPRHRRKDERVVEILLYKGEGVHVNLLVAQFLEGPLKLHTAADLAHRLKLERAEVDRLLAALGEQREVVAVQDGKSWLMGSTYRMLADKLLTLLASLQQAGPHRVGWKREELWKLFLDHPNKLVEAVLLELARRGEVAEDRERFHLPGHVPTLSGPQQAMFDMILADIRKNEFGPPTLDDIRTELSLEPKLFRLLQEYLVEACVIQYITKEVYFLTETLEKIRTRIADYVRQHGSVTPAQCRDLLGTSRKFVIPVLEYLDETRFTRREGDARVLAHA